MKRWIAQRQIEDVIALHQVAEDLPGIWLQPALQCSRQLRILCLNARHRRQRVNIDIGSDKRPAVGVMADDGINRIGPDTDIQHPHLLPTRHLTPMTAGQQIRQMVNVIGTPRDRRTEIPVGNIPALNAIIGHQDGLVQRLDRRRVGKIDGLAMRQCSHEGLQSRRGRQQPGKVITSLVRIARMQRRLGGFGHDRLG